MQKGLLGYFAVGSGWWDEEILRVYLQKGGEKSLSL